MKLCTVNLFNFLQKYFAWEGSMEAKRVQMLFCLPCSRLSLEIYSSCDHQEGGHPLNKHAGEGHDLHPRPGDTPGTDTPVLNKVLISCGKKKNIPLRLWSIKGSNSPWGMWEREIGFPRNILHLCTWEDIVLTKWSSTVQRPEWLISFESHILHTEPDSRRPWYRSWPWGPWSPPL